MSDVLIFFPFHKNIANVNRNKKCPVRYRFCIYKFLGPALMELW